MSTLSNIRDTIRAMSASSESHWHLAKVVSVGSSGELCDVEVDGSVWSGVRLTAVTGASGGIKLYPAVGSRVMVADFSGGRMTDMGVVMYSNIERVEIGGAEHTSANADVLKSELGKLTERVDTIIDALTKSATAAQDGGATYKANITLQLQAITSKEDFSGIEDETIRH